MPSILALSMSRSRSWTLRVCRPWRSIQSLARPNSHFRNPVTRSRNRNGTKLGPVVAEPTVMSWAGIILALVAKVPVFLLLVCLSNDVGIDRLGRRIILIHPCCFSFAPRSGTLSCTFRSWRCFRYTSSSSQHTSHRKPSSTPSCPCPTLHSLLQLVPLLRHSHQTRTTLASIVARNVFSGPRYTIRRLMSVAGLCSPGINPSSLSSCCNASFRTLLLSNQLDCVRAGPVLQRKVLLLQTSLLAKSGSQEIRRLQDIYHTPYWGIGNSISSLLKPPVTTDAQIRLPRLPQ